MLGVESLDVLDHWLQVMHQQHYWAADLGGALCIGLSTTRFRSNAHRHALAPPARCAAEFPLQMGTRCSVHRCLQIEFAIPVSSSWRRRAPHCSVHEVHIDEQQMRWFEATLQRSGGRPVIVFTHVRLRSAWLLWTCLALGYGGDVLTAAC